MGIKLWEAEYNGHACTVREITQDDGEQVNTTDDVVHARKGDYVALDLVRAPRGYRSRHIEKVIRAKDNRLVLGREISPSEPEPEDDTDYYDEDSDVPAPPVKKATSSPKK